MTRFEQFAFAPDPRMIRNEFAHARTRTLWRALLFLCACLCFVSFSADVSASSPAESSSASAADPAASPSKSSDAPLRWIPDQRVLAGAPPTTIDFAEVAGRLCDVAAFGGRPGEYKPDGVELSIVKMPGDFAEVSFVGRDLKIDWKENAVGKGRIVVKASVQAADAKDAYFAFNAEAWKPDYSFMLAAALGGLGLFLFGMKRMSDGLQAIAGSRMRRMISMFTNNRFLALGVGLLTTAVVQSSSATTCMTLSFVDSGLMTLKQAVGVIMGTNIGTTTTGWLLTLKIGDYGLPALGVAALVLIFAKSEKVRNYATFALGLGMVFFGLQTMSKGLAPLPEIPQFSNLVAAFEADSFIGAFKCVCVGCLTTIMVQSSSATVAITMTLVALNAISFESGAALVLGENIGTTTTALLSSLGSTINAKRSAYFHCLFNVLGVAWALCLFFPVLLPAVNALGSAAHLDPAGRIALTHTVFNVTNTILFLPFVGAISGLLTKYVKDSAAKQPKTVTGLTSFRNEAPILAVERSRMEVQKMFIDCRAMLDDLHTVKKENFTNESEIEKTFEMERKLDAVQDETIEFVSKLTTRTFSRDFAASAREQIRVAEELESISDYLAGILKSNLKLKEASVPAPKQIDSTFEQFLGYADDTLTWLGECFTQRKHRDVAAPMGERRKTYVKEIKQSRDEFLNSMIEDKAEPLAIVAVDYQLNAWRRIYEHLLNIAEALEGPGMIK